MHEDIDLTRQETHFAFGKNWASYAAGAGAEELAEARRGLAELLGPDLGGRRFLDIGCGSGIHALAAVSLGAGEVLAVDIDPDSVATTRRMLETHAPGSRWTVRQASVFELDPATTGTFDVVYSWGVLHHTGDMERAVRNAAALVAPGGEFAIALYRRTLCCGLWKIEKRWYAKASPEAQRVADRIYTRAFGIGLAATGRRLSTYVAGYRGRRGMDFAHDVRDWLGGWPYESISAEQVDRLLVPLGFELRKLVGRRGLEVGAFGVGCNEYVYRRT
jgi:2-polyprenyl-6-hydroxyphenyl methylase/3-demethylubiquinone-9 3-methyltransferase